MMQHVVADLVVLPDADQFLALRIDGRLAQAPGEADAQLLLLRARRCPLILPRELGAQVRGEFGRGAFRHRERLDGKHCGRAIVQRSGYRSEPDRWEQRGPAYYRHVGSWQRDDHFKEPKMKKEKKAKHHKEGRGRGGKHDD